MKFAVGYQLSDYDEEPFADIVEDYKEHIEEVYFPWMDLPSGRSPIKSLNGLVDWTAQERLESDLKRFKELGIKLNLLLNASCFGKYSNSRYLTNRICSVISHIEEDVCNLDSVTTMSPVIAEQIKKYFSHIRVKASVNMRIGTVKAMEYVVDIFDDFYMQREFNRDFKVISQLKEWCNKNDKGLYILVNSGCLRNCSVQTFHDNLVAHEKEASEIIQNENNTSTLCWKFFSNKENMYKVLQNTWIRPEDLHNYESYFPVAKLATRMHANPRSVIKAYCTGKYNGNLLSLFEPSHVPIFNPVFLDNERFPEDWHQKVTNCSKECYDCNYCKETAKDVLVDVSKKMREFSQ